MQLADQSIFADLKDQIIPGTKLYTVIDIDFKPPAQVLLAEQGGNASYVIVMKVAKWVICPWISNAFHTILASLPAPALKLLELPEAQHDNLGSVAEMKAAIAKRMEDFSAKLDNILANGRRFQNMAESAFQASVAEAKGQQ